MLRNRDLIPSLNLLGEIVIWERWKDDQFVLTQIEDTAVVTSNVTLAEEIHQIDAQLNVPERQSRRELLGILERVELVKGIAVEKLMAMAESRLNTPAEPSIDHSPEDEPI